MLGQDASLDASQETAFLPLRRWGLQILHSGFGKGVGFEAED